jgi:cytochrome P450
VAQNVEDVDLFDPQTQEDWYPAYDVLRAEAPAYRLPGTDIYVLTRYDDVQAALRRPDRFPNGRGANSLLSDPAARSYWDEHGWLKKTPLGTNPPEHRLYRELVDRFFDAAGAERHRSMITEIVHRLIDEWIDQRSIELVSAFALPLPVEVITRIIGFPVEDIAQLKVWSEAWVMPFAMNLTSEQEMYHARQAVEFQRYIYELAEARRTDPRDDVITHLVNARFDGQRPLEAWEIINIVDHLYIGGNETTTFALTSGIWLLAKRPDVEARLRADPALIAEFVEEVLRLESPTQGLFRLVAEDVEIGGVKIPAGSTVHLRYAAANRDAAMFANPADLDLDRSNKRRHVAFALGEHHCPGAGLSRLEQVIAFDALLSRLATIELAPHNTFSHKPGFVLRALDALHITFTPSAEPST